MSMVSFRKVSKRLITLAVVADLSIVASRTSAESLNHQIQSALRSVSPLELPNAAAQLVKVASANSKEATAIAIVEVVAKLNPAAMPSVVGAICRILPAVGSATVTEALKLEPKLASPIQQAAAPYLVTPLGSPTSTARNSSLKAQSAGNGDNHTSSHGEGNINANGNGSDNNNGNGKKKGHYKNPD